METNIKIVDVTMTLSTWADLPHVTYAPIIKMGGSVRLGLLSVTTDDGIVGHGFLGSSNRSAERDSQVLIENIKPVIMGQNPTERERLAGDLWKAAHSVSVPAGSVLRMKRSPVVSINFATAWGLKGASKASPMPSIPSSVMSFTNIQFLPPGP
jgi:hypothetical protein